jgi:hypothetical protein
LLNRSYGIYPVVFLTRNRGISTVVVEDKEVIVAMSSAVAAENEVKEVAVENGVRVKVVAVATVMNVVSETYCVVVIVW